MRQTPEGRNRFKAAIDADARLRRARWRGEDPRPRETLADYLARGGEITVCPPGAMSRELVLTPFVTNSQLGQW